MTLNDFAGTRIDYTKAALEESMLASSPVEQLRAWIEEAIKAGVTEPNAMALSTVKRDGFPSSRIVLMRALDDTGLRFYTNYGSAKGEELKSGRASVLFFWHVLERQVRIEGTVAQLSGEESDAYFRSRPRESQLGAWASEQSQVLPSRAVLEARYQEVEARFAGKSVSRPPFWGGYLLAPHRFEFWQGRKSRLHDRLVYVAEGAGHRIERLSP
jgi:pyridoxamine 5'-phosphate oxidase